MAIMDIIITLTTKEVLKELKKNPPWKDKDYDEDYYYEEDEEDYDDDDD